jgi:hypothetical protein
MATITAIELGPDTCALARTSVRRGEIRLLASEILDPAAFPGGGTFTIAVHQARRAMHLARRCRVVVWGLPEGASRTDSAVRPIIQPLTDAGFKVERVVTPCNALAALARRKTSRGDGSSCWVAINRGGVAIVAVRPGKLLYAHSFVWDSTVGAIGSQARLLQRYSLVSYISPQVKRAMAEARKAGSLVGVVVTCGNLPDLRSLTMPLIEELDVEVETLDSLEGLTVRPESADKLAESASAIRLACAAVIARGSRPWDASKAKKKPSRTGAYAAAAVLATILAGLAYLWSTRTRFAGPFPPAPQSQQTQAPLPAAKTLPSPVSGAPPVPRTGSTGLNPAAVPADKPLAGPAARSAGIGSTGASSGVTLVRLPDSVPRVTAILVSRDRRYATIEGGRIVGIGDVMGRRTVVGIDDRSVLLREPSGVQIRVGLGGRLLRVEQPDGTADSR